MLPVNCGSHADYQHFVVTNLRKYYPDPDALARSTWDIIERFWNLDLSFTDTFMADKYSKFGPAPRTPSSMQRSYLLSIDFKVTSLTEWAAQLKMNPLYASLSGFEPGNTPGVGTFYDFIKRLWNSDDDHMSPHIHPLKTRVNFLSRIGPSTSLAVICAACSFRQLYVSFDFFHLCAPPYHWIYLNQMYVTSV